MLGLVRVISPFRCLGHTDIHQRSALSESSPLSRISATQTSTRGLVSHLPFPGCQRYRHASRRGLIRVISPFYVSRTHKTYVNARPCQSHLPFFFYVSRTHKTYVNARPCRSHLSFLCVSDTQDIRQCAALSVISPFYVSRTHKTYVNARPCRSHCPFLCVISCVSIPSSKPLATANRTDVSEDS